MMYLDVTTILVFFCIFLLTGWLINRRRAANIPPGPKPWPVVGNIPQFANESKTLHFYMYRLSKKYGPVMSIQIGSQLMVYLNNYRSVKEAFVKQSHNFSIRPPPVVAMGKKILIDIGVVHSIGESWKDIRRFALAAFRDFGVGKKTTEERIQEEISAVLDVIKGYGQAPFDPWTFLPKAVSNIICSVCFGTRFAYDDTQFVDLLERIKYITSNIGVASQIIAFPWLRFIPFLQSSITKKLSANGMALRKFLDDQIAAHKVDFDPNNIRDFVDLYVQEEAKGNGSFTRENMRGIIRDLFLAGTDTTATSLYWALLFMIAYPGVQKKCQEEIDQFIGSGRLPTSSDRPKTPYIEATIQEISRLTAIVSFGLPHCCLSDAKINGFDTPKNAFVLANIYAIHRDPRVWQDPETFKPERWLVDGKVIHCEEMIPFSVGPRICLREALAKMELYLFFTSFLQRFIFKPETPEVQVGIKGTFGAVYSPNPFKVRVEER